MSFMPSSDLLLGFCITIGYFLFDQFSTFPLGSGYSHISASRITEEKYASGAVNVINNNIN